MSESFVPSAYPDLSQAASQIVGKDRVRAPRESESRAATLIVEPASVGQISTLVRMCENDHVTLAPMGAARTLSMIRRRPVVLGISLARTNRIIAHEPADMTVTVEAGITLGELNRSLASDRQRLALDPAFPDTVTIGSLIGASQAGPIRLSEGRVRDLLIGIQYVGHGGRVVRGGGRVVKNVAGYDLMKVMTGSFGTLGIVTEATFKASPIPENYEIAIARFSNPQDGFVAADAIIARISPVHIEVLSMDAGVALGHSEDFHVIAGIAGNAPELEYQRSVASNALGSATTILSGDEAQTAYVRLRDFAFPENSIVGQIAVPPNELSRCVRGCNAEFRAHGGSGVAQLWMEHGGATDVQAVARWRSMARSANGNLRLLAAPASIRDSLAAFDQPGPGAFELMKRLKAAFDPASIFNPGSFVGGI